MSQNISFDWLSFLTQWSKEILVSDLDPFDDIEPEDSDKEESLIAPNWLGYAGATQAQIKINEERLGVTLPPSYRNFLEVTNGWRRTTDFIYRIYPIEKVEWFATNYQWLIDIWSQSISLFVPDNQYFVNGQNPLDRGAEYLQTALQISKQGDTAYYLLNPKVINADGEWEAWFFAEWLHGARIYPSFLELMQAEHTKFLTGRNITI